MQKILIIGLGLIGGSFAKAVLAHNVAQKIYAFDPDFEAINLAKEQKIITSFSLLDENLADFDLIVIASPLKTYSALIEQIDDILSKTRQKHPIIIELGSLKEFFINKIPQNLQENFIACHPIAGSDKSGFENADANLFNDKKFLICKHKNNSNETLKIVENIILKIKAKPEFIDSKTHDDLYGLVSHLPQFLSFLTKENSPKLNESPLSKAFRLDNSNPEIWEDIFKLNEKNIEKYYYEFFDNLQILAQNLQKNQFLELINYIKEINLKTDNDNFSLDLVKIDEKILFRLIIVASYLKINKIKEALNYAGKGFKDFSSIISLINLDKEILINSFKTHQNKILSFIAQL